ncbi:MAG TPA: enolase C-terminal domain-like protein [Burkholderiales bacterium]|nr:enolase C-terminal domain-like protein [Burkholderiales bacterium]
MLVTDLPQRLQREVSSGAYDTGAPGTLLGKPVLVKIHADGVTGYGQIRPISPGHFMPDTVHSMVGAIAGVYGPRLIGKDLLDMESILALFDRALPANMNARAALDHALHDAIGKALKLPAYKVLGGLAQERIPLEWSVSMADDPARMVADAERAMRQFGIHVLCLKAGGKGGWRRDVENFVTVRKAVGGDVTIGVDPNEGWTVSEAIRAVHALAPHRLDYLEQPVKRQDIAGMAALRRELAGVPLMADEGVMTLGDAWALAKAEAVDVFCVKLYKMGGLRAAKKIAAVAEAAGIQLNVGGLAVHSQLEAAAGAHFYASTPECLIMPAAEFIFGLGVLGPDPLVPETDFVIRDGHVTPPSRPGLGIAVDERAVERHTLKREVVT